MLSLAPTTSASGVRKRGRSRHRACKSQCAIMAKAAPAWPGLPMSWRYSAWPWASSCEPVPSSSFCRISACAARQEKSSGTKGALASSLASGEKNCPAQPSSGSKAPLTENRRSGASSPSSAMRQAMAAPAECPTTTEGTTSSACSTAATPCAMPTIEQRAATWCPSGMALKPWPGKSKASTDTCGRSKGMRPRQEWVEAPVPCSSSTVGACASG